MAIHPDPDRDPADAFAIKVFAKCPNCELVTPPAPTEQGQGVDWSRPVFVGCPCCGQAYRLSRADLLALDEVATCPSCRAHTPCPREAAQVRCRSCAELYPGPHSDPARVRSVQTRRVRLVVEAYREIDNRLEE